MFSKQTVREYLFTLIGTFIVTIGVYYFLVPQNLATGGISGLSIVLTNYLPLSISSTNFILNFILLLVGFIFLGRDFAQEKTYSEETAAVVDEEMKKIIDACYNKALEILRANEENLHAVAKVLLEKEKITGEEFEAIFNNK